MKNILLDSAYFGVLVSLGTYFIGVKIKQKTKLEICNPLLISIILTIILLSILHIDYNYYHQSASHLSYLLTPATICLALPLYRQIEILKKYKKLIFISILSGCITCFVVIIVIAFIMKIDYSLFVSLIPKSITTAIAIEVSKEAGGISGITVAAVVITGVLSAIVSNSVFKIFNIQHPISKGLALGTSGHAVGTSKAIELGEVEASMSSLAIVVAGIMTVILVPILLNI